MHKDHNWRRTGLWRLEGPDGTLKAESSNEAEVRSFMEPGDTLLVHLACTEEKWAVTQ